MAMAVVTAALEQEEEDSLPSQEEMASPCLVPQLACPVAILQCLFIGHSHQVDMLVSSDPVTCTGVLQGNRTYRRQMDGCM